MAKHHVRSQRNRDHRFTRFSFLLIFLTILFSSSAFGFYAPLTNYTASYNGSLIKLSVYDPYRGTTVESDWLDYLTDFRQSNGVASWLSASDEMTVAVYDPARSTPWRTDTITDVAIENDHHTNENGIVGVYMGNATKSGVVCKIYKPLLGSFDSPFFPTNSNVTIKFGKSIMVVSWITTNSLPYNISALAYNVRDDCTRTKNLSPTATAIENWTIDSCDTVTFTYGSDTYYWAYNYNDNSWQQGVNTAIYTTPMACVVPEQTVSGSPSPENVWWFFDFSIGNTSSLITFGDDNSSTERSPGHPYVTSAIFNVQQTVSGCGSNDIYNTSVTNSITAPTGSISISDTNPTYDNTVNLHLTFDSYVDDMRLKNESDSTWGVWQSAVNPYTGWELSSGYGVKTVSVQYFDDYNDHISQEYTAQINYYPAIAITYPNGGEYLKQGNSYNVTWTYAGSNNVRVELWNNGSYQATLASAVSAGTTSTNCTIPVNHNETSSWFGSNYKIRVIDTVFNHYDESDGNFNIGDIWMTAPNGSESLVHGTTYSIQFTAREIPSDPIKITLWDNDVKIGAIADNITITNPENSISWTLVGDLIDGSGCTGINEEITSLGANFKIQARAGTTEFKDSSDSNFTINGIRVSAPNGDYCNSGEIVNQILIYGNQYSISWDALSLPTGDIKITLMQGTTTLGVIATDLPNTQTSYNWTVGKDLNGNDFTPSTGTGFKVRVRVKDQAVIDESDNSFEIQNP